MSTSKITGEEERYSHTDLVDFEANVQGARGRVRGGQADPRDEGSRTSPTDVEAKFAAVNAALAAVPDGQHDFVAYTALDQADTKALAQAIDALAEPLSKVGKEVVNS